MEKMIKTVTEYYGFEVAEFLGNWKEYEVYRLSMDEPDVVIGLPIYLLVDGETIRPNTPDETFEIFDHFMDEYKN